MKSESGRLRLNWIEWLSLLLVIVGALNWGLVGLGSYADANWNLVDLLLGWAPAVENLVYVLVGLAGLYVVYFVYKLRKVRARGRASAEETM